ncbi:MAG: zf-HC2 domain-containing protein [Betaproteobacteria bacterium]
MDQTIQVSCKEAARLMSRQQDEALSTDEQEHLRNHLFVCLSCRRFDMQLGFLRRLARRYGEQGEDGGNGEQGEYGGDEKVAPKTTPPESGSSG